VSEKSELSIRAAIMNCLARCTESDVPLCCLADFLEHLRALDWSEDATRQVEAAVLELLRSSSVAAAETEAA